MGGFLKISYIYDIYIWEVNEELLNVFANRILKNSIGFFRKNEQNWMPKMYANDNNPLHNKFQKWTEKNLYLYLKILETLVTFLHACFHLFTNSV